MNSLIFFHEHIFCQEVVLKEAGVPIPSDYVPKTKSFTLAAPTPQGHNVQILLDAYFLQSSLQFLT